MRDVGRVITALGLLFAACGDDGTGDHPDAAQIDAQAPPDTADESDAGVASDAIAPPDAEDFCASLRAALQPSLAIIAAEPHRPGAVIGVQTPECGTITEVIGLADVEAETPMTDDLIFPIGFNTEWFTNVVVLQLVDEGLLGLDDALATWFPDYPSADSITIRQMLNFTSGIPCYIQDHPFEWLWSYQTHRDLSPAEVIAEMQLHELLFDPGEGVNLSLTDHLLLGAIVEQVTGLAIEQQIRNRLLDPLGLEHTFVAYAEEVVGEQTHTYGRSDVPGWTDITHVNDSCCFWADTSMYSNAHDLLPWAREFATGDILSETIRHEQLDRMVYWGDQFGGRWFRGLGGDLGLLYNGVYVIADWTNSLACTHVAYVPALDASVVLLVNASGGTATTASLNAFASLLLHVTELRPDPS